MLCESCGFAAAIETVPDRRHRVPSTFRLCRDCAAEARGVLIMPPRTENHDARLAMLRALAAHNGPMTREMLLVAIAAEEDEKRMLHGVISGLIRATYVTAAGANLHLTPKGRRQVEPDASPPPVTSPGREAREPGPLWTQAETAALSDLRAAVECVGIQGRNLFVTCDLLAGAREAIEVMAQRSGSLITALRAIEAALPGGPSGLSADAIADRAVFALRTIHNLQRIERLHNDDREAKERAEAERDKAVADLLDAAREAIEVMESRQAKAEEARRSIIETAKDGEGMQEQLSREVSDLIRALRSIEAALLGDHTGLTAAAIADRAVGLLHGCADGAREREALRQERDDSQREYAALDDVFECEKAAHAETRAAQAAAEAEITRLRADLEGALAAEKATAEKLAEAESEVTCLRVGGPYWTRQGDRHMLSILRPVEVAVLNVLDTGRSLYWEAGPHSGRVDASSPEALDLAQRLAEVAAGVRS